MTGWLSDQAAVEAVPVHGRPLAVVTGASSGIGAAFAVALAARGHDLLLIARNRERLGRVAAEVRAGNVVAVEVRVVDLSANEQLEALAQGVTARAPDLLINAAGFGTFGPLEDADPATQEALVAVGLVAPLRLTMAVLPAMRRRGSGAIVNVASIGALVPAPDNAAYCAAKAGLVALTRSLAVELEGSGVVVQALCPGLTRTGFHATAEYAGISVPRLIPSLLWDCADHVVAASLHELGRRVVVVPRMRDRLLVAGLRSGLVPFPRAAVLREAQAS